MSSQFFGAGTQFFDGASRLIAFAVGTDLES
jgi:hypothetical protein